ncbi:MAG: hypothetical protein JXR48_07620 [Candidatus Delongbacteria bacterium]|nr:hypothetical protein [Candidatus Delongbacteria bacterium]MBN2834819.1 hypothetical protein [Candidatus Delongbacteria bacterium]
MDSVDIKEIVTSGNLNKLEELAENGYDFVFSNKENKLLQLLLSSSKQDDDKLHMMIDLICGSGVMPDSYLKPWEKTPLYIAAEKKYTEAYKLLVKFGGNENRKYSSIPLCFLGFGKTPKSLMEK